MNNLSLIVVFSSFKYFDLKTLLSAALVSPVWADQVESNIRWKELYEERWGPYPWRRDERSWRQIFIDRLRVESNEVQQIFKNNHLNLTLTDLASKTEHQKWQTLKDEGIKLSQNARNYLKVELLTFHRVAAEIMGQALKIKSGDEEILFHLAYSFSLIGELNRANLDTEIYIRYCAIADEFLATSHDKEKITEVGRDYGKVLTMLGAELPPKKAELVYQKAIRVYQQLRMIEKSDPSMSAGEVVGLCGIARSFLERSNLAEANLYFEKAHALLPAENLPEPDKWFIQDNYALYDHAARALVSEGRNQERELKEALRLVDEAQAKLPTNRSPSEIGLRIIKEWIQKLLIDSENPFDIYQNASHFNEIKEWISIGNNYVHRALEIFSYASLPKGGTLFFILYEIVISSVDAATALLPQLTEAHKQANKALPIFNQLTTVSHYDAVRGFAHTVLALKAIQMKQQTLFEQQLAEAFDIFSKIKPGKSPWSSYYHAIAHSTALLNEKLTNEQASTHELLCRRLLNSTKPTLIMKVKDNCWYQTLFKAVWDKKWFTLIRTNTSDIDFDLDSEWK